jgi:penicillin-insensitive murein endopeptidase
VSYALGVLTLMAAAVAALASGPDAGAAPDGGAPPGPTAAEVAARWNALRAPRSAAPRSIGTYAAGCLDGAVALAPSGPGYEVLHLGRHRRFGHPDLIAYLRRLGAEVKRRRMGLLLVGDLGQPRGGPTPSGHRSHQTGLDADVGYVAPRWMLHRRLTTKERETVGPPAVVDLTTRELTPAWQPRILELLQLAATDPAVERIFVNPVVKREACARARAGADWLRKLRPWWLHHDHFHVRLRCPAGSPECEPQPPLGPEDGCGETLRWWFTEDSKATSEKRSKEPPAAPALPAACDELLDGRLQASKGGS